MSLSSVFKSVFASGVKEFNKEYGKTSDFLHAVTASCALVIFADGNAEDSEKEKAMKILSGHTQLSSIYTGQQIKEALSDALNHAESNSGKQELARQLDKVLTLPNAKEMSDDVYLMALDVAASNSRHEVGEFEQKVLDKLAKRLSVDTSKFDFS